jgi:ABC-type multidrug transport system fused ATPase/permease subunit
VSAAPPGIRFDAVSAGYGGATVLRELSWTVERGALVGIVGPSD